MVQENASLSPFRFRFGCATFFFLVSPNNQHLNVPPHELKTRAQSKALFFNTHIIISIRQGSPNFGPRTHTSCQVFCDFRLEIKCMINVKCLNYPETTPYPSPVSGCGKTIFHETSPCAKNVGDHCRYISMVCLCEIIEKSYF